MNVEHNQLILSSGAGGSYRDLFVFLDLLAWHANSLGVQGIADTTGELAEAHLDEVMDQDCFSPRESVWASNLMQCCLIVVSLFHTELIP